MKFMIKIAALALIINFAQFSKADTIAYPVTANVVSNLFVGAKIIKAITAIATSTNNTTFRFYDTPNTGTTYVQVAYSRLASYATNITYVFTNEAGLLVTNTFTGRWTYPTSVSASTNTRPTKQIMVVPASSTRTIEIPLMTTLGLAVLPDFNGIVEVEYENNP